jgi:transposase-like protein
VTQAERDVRRKLRVLRHAQETGNVSKTCRYFGVSRTSFYDWKLAYETKGEEGLINSKPCPKNPVLRTPAHISRRRFFISA